MSWMRVNVDKLISAIRKRPALYNRSLMGSEGAKVKQDLWEEVAAEVYEDWSRCSAAMRKLKVKLLSKKWKTVRDNYVRHYRLMDASAGRKKKYVLYDDLKFLNPFVRPTPNKPKDLAFTLEERVAEIFGEDSEDVAEETGQEIYEEQETVAETTEEISALLNNLADTTGDPGVLVIQDARSLKEGFNSTRRRNSSEESREMSKKNDSSTSRFGSRTSLVTRTPPEGRISAEEFQEISAKKNSSTARLGNRASLMSRIPTEERNLAEDMPTKKDSSMDHFGNRAFLMSYLPIMDSLSHSEMLHARMLISQMFLEKSQKKEASSQVTREEIKLEDDTSKIQYNLVT